ncbi:MAG: DUF3611 family protein, partial [Bacteroidota bacterium]
VYDQRANNLGTGAGLSLVGLGLVSLFAGAGWAFRYTRLSKKLRAKTSGIRPKPKDVTQALQIGMVINLSGLLLTLLGAEAIIGALIGKALAQPQGSVGFLNPGSIKNFIEPLDIFIVQAATHTVVAHYVGIVAGLLTTVPIQLKKNWMMAQN